MKVSKLKTLLYLLGVMVIFAGITVDAASLSITKSSSTTENQAIFEIYLDASDGEISNQTLKIQSSSTSIKPSIRVADNVNDVICNSDGVCAMQGTYSSKIKIAEVTLKNTTSSDIADVTLSAAIEGIGNITSEAVNLKTEVTTTTKTKSKNAELSNLTTSVGTMDPAFTKEGRSYTIKGIKDTVNSITFSATCENCTTTYTCLENCSISENKNNRIMLEDGANSIELTTTSEDGSNQVTYNFVVYRGEIEKPSAYLKDLKIEGVEFDKKDGFDWDINNYTATVDLSVEKLNIKYELEDPEAKVEIKGGDKLVEGENTITITVTSRDGESKQVYTITVNKEEICDPETEDCEEEVKDVVVVEKKNPNKIWLIVIISVVALAIIGISGYFIFKKKNNKNNKNDKNDKPDSKIKKAFIEEDPEEETEDSNKLQEEIIEPKIKPSIDEALEDLMKTKEIELNNL